MKRLRHAEKGAGNNQVTTPVTTCVTTSNPLISEAVTTVTTSPCTHAHDVCAHVCRRAYMCAGVYARAVTLLRLLRLLQASGNKGLEVTTHETT